MNRTENHAIGFIFDLDGTLLDDVGLVQELPKYLASIYGKSLTEQQMIELRKEIFEDISGTGSRWLVVKSLLFLAKKMGVPWYKRFGFLKKANNFYLDRINDCPLFEETEQILTKIKQEYGPVGIYTTSSQKEILERFQERKDFLNLFENAIIGRDNVKRTKPSPEGIEKLSKSWRIPCHRLVMVGDMITDIQAGQAVGTYTIGVLTGFAKRDEFEEVGVDLVIREIKEIKNHFREIEESLLEHQIINE